MGYSATSLQLSSCIFRKLSASFKELCLTSGAAPWLLKCWPSLSCLRGPRLYQRWYRACSCCLLCSWWAQRSAVHHPPALSTQGCSWALLGQNAAATQSSQGCCCKPQPPAGQSSKACCCCGCGGSSSPADSFFSFLLQHDQPLFWNESSCLNNFICTCPSVSWKTQITSCSMKLPAKAKLCFSAAA